MKEEKMLREELHSLQERLLESATLVESMIEKGIRGLSGRDRDLLLQVMEEDETRENEIEVEIEESCIELLARYQPQARDLRGILMILKMNNDLERMGDEAVNIAESSLFLIERPPVKPLIDIPRMAQEAMGMLRDSLSSLIREDTALASSVCQRDDVVDSLRDQILRELITYMASDPSTIERSLHLLRISRSLERIADLSTNICEDVIYMVEGKVIKHHRFVKEED
ncbi:MAG: phosphate transport system regulatory protein PhoU [Deltaproteobacteria bacterium]|nr:MAG: phosphate transport system regulatory protein PhoU [Deltaproteobacteria bacterium]